MGFTSGDGPISRLDNGAEKHAIRFLLSVVDLLFFEMGGRTADQAEQRSGNQIVLVVVLFVENTANRGRGGGRKTCATSALSVVHFLFALFHTRDVKQAFRSYVASGARSLHLVAKGKNPVA